MKLNKRGITTIEVLIAFVLLAIIVVSMYGTVETYKNRQNIESYKNTILTYKNLLTKDIQDDLIKKNLVDVSINYTQITTDGSGKITTPETYNVKLFFRDGTSKVLKVERVLADDYGESSYTTEPVSSGTCSNNKNDYFAISYGPEDDMISYPVPELGSGENDTGCKIQDLRMTDININNDNDILTIFINFYHPDFGSKYSINIVCPINFNK